MLQQKSLLIQTNAKKEKKKKIHPHEKSLMPLKNTRMSLPEDAGAISCNDMACTEADTGNIQSEGHKGLLSTPLTASS